MPRRRHILALHPQCGDGVATRVETGTLPAGDGTRNVTGRMIVPASLGSVRGRRREAPSCTVIGLRTARRSRPLEDPTKVHDRDTVRHVPHHAEVGA